MGYGQREQAPSPEREQRCCGRWVYIGSGGGQEFGSKKLLHCMTNVQRGQRQTKVRISKNLRFYILKSVNKCK